MSFFSKHKVFIIGLLTSALSAALEMMYSSETSMYVIGFAIASAIFTYAHKNSPGAAGTIAGVIGSQLAAFQAAHASPSGIAWVDIGKYVLPVLIAILGVYAQPVSSSGGDSGKPSGS